MPYVRKTKKPRKVITAPTLPVTDPVIFDGKVYAAEHEKLLKNKVEELKSLGVNPKFADIITTKDKASKFYVSLKKKAAERVGIEMEVYEMTSSGRDYKFLMNLIGVLGRDPTMHGVMLQIPLANRYIPYKKWILDTIPEGKDVDGLREDSPFMPATVKAIVGIIDEAQKAVLLRRPPPVFVVGSQGMVGNGVMKALKALGYQVKGFDAKKNANWRDKWGVPSFMSLKADVIVSATGVPGLIEARHVAKGAAVIDVGAPKPEVRFKEVKTKASFITPVPGGVGPVTVVSLLENVVEAAYNTLTTHSEGMLS